MTSHIRTLAVVGTGVMLASVTLTGAAHAQTNCDWYAKTALSQQKQNVDRKCGYSGDGWSSNFAVHRGWCNSVSPDRWRKAALEREQALQKCTRKAGLGAN